MPIELNATHDPARRSWVESACGDTDFPIQNLPFGRFSVGEGTPRIGVALGDRIIDLARLAEAGLLPAVPDMAALMAMSAAALSALRATLSDLFREGGTGERSALEAALVPMAEATLHLPVKPCAFTDFCASADHIRRMGAASGAPPRVAWFALPVAYNGRASSVAISGTPVVRPKGQYELPPGSANIHYGPEPMLDFELEFGLWLRGGTALGQTVSVAQAEELMFGCCLVNDWSARGIQFFEMLLGPHLGKSFLTTISPWIVTMEALAPFRVAARGRTAEEPAVPAYLLDAADRAMGAVRVELTADLGNSAGSSKRIVRTQLSDLLWTMAQMVTHQASGGAPLEAGDLIATGTVSGPAEDARACMAEITARGATPVLLPDGSKRVMLEDGDTLTIRGRATADGHVPIGFGACSGTIHPARDWA
ncbi:fumarylacetoacetate hydrolase family protein [Novosphingobium sp. BL-52-GroH]|uniref:fumarylacetoacetate hydrolase family protein n=1 Tax=Novosphingobium sp. BL-52-GroH TaxID=3349877 RepID=UPI00384D127F